MDLDNPRADRLAIDVHAHAIPPSAAVYGSALGATRGGRPIAEDISARSLEMDRLNVDMQILSLSPSLWFYGSSDLDTVAAARRVNDDFGAAAAEEPARYRAFAHLPLDHPAAAAAELLRAMESPFVVGAAIPCHVNGVYWDDEELRVVLEAAQECDALLFVHPESVRMRGLIDCYHLPNLVGNPTETTFAIGSFILGGVLDALPRLRLVFAHGGGYAAYAAGRWDHGYTVRSDAHGRASRMPSSYLPRLYFDSLLHSETALRFLIDAVGIGRVMLGTDYPADMGPSDPVGQLLGYSSLSEREKSLVIRETLAGLLEI